MIVTSSSEDDEAEAHPANRAAMLPAVAPGGTETRGMRQTREATATAHQGAQASTVWARPSVLEASSTPPVVTTQADAEGPAIARVTPATAASAPNRSVPRQGGSEQARRFHAVNYESQL
jgi:hypothetical protein